MNQHVYDFPPPGLHEDGPDTIYQKRIGYGKKFLVWIAYGLVGTALVGMIIVGIFAPSFLWTVAAACTLLLLSGVVTIAFIVYWAFRSYQLSHSRQSATGNQMRNTSKAPDAVIDAEVRIVEIHSEERT